jgi:hypothetical protein
MYEVFFPAMNRFYKSCHILLDIDHVLSNLFETHSQQCIIVNIKKRKFSIDLTEFRQYFLRVVELYFLRFTLLAYDSQVKQSLDTIVNICRH